MDRIVINGKLIGSNEINFGKGKAVVNEYSPNLTKEETRLNRMIVKSILAKTFSKSRANKL